MTLTGSINLACGCRIPFDATRFDHRQLRDGHVGEKVSTCRTHGEQVVRTVAVTGSMAELFPDPVERREAERDFRLDHLD